MRAFGAFSTRVDKRYDMSAGLGGACTVSKDCLGYPNARCMTDDNVEAIDPAQGGGVCRDYRGYCEELRCETANDCSRQGTCTECVGGFCARDFTKGLPNGAAGCKNVFDCQDPDAVCDFSNREGYTTGICMQPVDSVCGNPDYQCIANADCPRSCGFCVNGACTTAGGTDTDACTNDEQCADGFSCKFAFGEPRGQCVQQCTKDTVCPEVAPYCARGECSATQARPLEACGASKDCVVGYKCDGGFCVIDRKGGSGEGNGSFPWVLVLGIVLAVLIMGVALFLLVKLRK